METTRVLYYVGHQIFGEISGGRGRLLRQDCWLIRTRID